MPPCYHQLVFRSIYQTFEMCTEVGRLEAWDLMAITMSQAMTGADELFLVTDNVSANHSYDGESQQGKNAVDAAKEVTSEQLK